MRAIICVAGSVDFIESHLGDQSLSPKKIAASSQISLSYPLQPVHDNETTVSQFVQTKRLQRAYEILVADPKGHRTVSEVAYEVGFKNVSHFSRCFSRHFKVAPRDVRQAPEAAPQRGPATRAAEPNGIVFATDSLLTQGFRVPVLGRPQARASRDGLEPNSQGQPLRSPARRAFPWSEHWTTFKTSFLRTNSLRSSMNSPTWPAGSR